MQYVEKSKTLEDGDFEYIRMYFLKLLLLCLTNEKRIHHKAILSIVKAIQRHNREERRMFPALFTKHIIGKCVGIRR